EEQSGPVPALAAAAFHGQERCGQLVPVGEARHVWSETGLNLNDRTAKGIKAGRVQFLVVLLAPQKVAHLPVGETVDSDQYLARAHSALDSKPRLRVAAAPRADTEAVPRRQATPRGFHQFLGESRGRSEGMCVFG